MLKNPSTHAKLSLRMAESRKAPAGTGAGLGIRPSGDQGMGGTDRSGAVRDDDPWTIWTMMAPHRIRSWSRLRHTVLALMACVAVASCAGQDRTPSPADIVNDSETGDPFTSIDRNPVKSLEEIKTDAQRVAADLGLEGAERDVAVIQSQFDQIYPSLQRLLIIEEDIRKLLATLGDLPPEQLGLTQEDLSAGGSLSTAPLPAGEPGAAEAPSGPAPSLNSVDAAAVAGEPANSAPAPNEAPVDILDFPGTPPEGTAMPGPAQAPMPARPAPLAQTTIPPAPTAPVDAIGVETIRVEDIAVEEVPIENGPASGPVQAVEAQLPAVIPPAPQMAADGTAWGIHLGTYSMADSARRDLVLMRRDFGSQLAGLSPVLKPLPRTSNGRPLNRLILGPLPSRETAAILCRRFTAQDRYCAPILFEGRAL